MNNIAAHSGVRKVLISPKLEGKAGREHLSGILGFLDAGHVWDVRIARSASELTPDAVRQALADGTEGFLLSVASPKGQKAVIDILSAAKVPVVVLDNHDARVKAGRFSYVRFDTDAIVAAGLDHLGKVMPGADVAEWLRALPVPTGILAANDLTALQVVETCAEAGISVPEQLAVLGIDNDELICGHARPPIATVEPNFYGAGFIAAATLQEMMEGHRAPRVVKVGESVNRIVARQSARPSSGAPTLVRQAMDLIRSNAAKLDVVRLAHALGVSRTKLTDAFAKSGSSVAAEIREVRFAKVMELLADPHQAIGPIANLCGWRSETHLMHFFRSRTGMTMREWRSRHLAPESATP